MGLNFAIPSRPNIEQSIIDIEAGMDSCKLSTEQTGEVRQIFSKITKTLPRHENSSDLKTVEELRKKPVFYLKADKGNKTVIMDKSDYDEQITQKIDKGPYWQLRLNPLADMVKRVENTIKECKPVLGNALQNLRVSNPVLPRIKGLPKIHKPGNEMREIISAVGAPTEKLAKWLVKEFQAMPHKFPSRSVKSTGDFVENLRSSGNIQSDEIMVSFDVTALFPSVPVNETLNLLEDWLLSQYFDNTWKKKVDSLLKLSRLCMKENYFTFRGKFYKQTKGAPMGNPLSPFLCELFMANIESTLEKRNILPIRWWRYVDDIFCILKRADLETFFISLNNTHKNINFTIEKELNNRLPFLDVVVVRKSTDLEFEIYRKPTNTKRVIPNTSNHPFQHKMASFHHMIHRMETLPLSEVAKQKELEYIFEIAKLNGYNESIIQAIVDKKKRAQIRKSFTTLTPITEDLKRVAVEYDVNLTRPLRSKFRKFGMDIVYTSRNTQLKTKLGSTKDPIDTLNKAGIYKIACSHCDMVYIGQTKRNLGIRFKEHFAEVTKASKVSTNAPPHHFKSKVAEHIFNEEHPLTSDNIHLLRPVNNLWKLDVAESLEIYKQHSCTLLNKDAGNHPSWLFNLLPKNPRHGTVNNRPHNSLPNSN